MYLLATIVVLVVLITGIRAEYDRKQHPVQVGSGRRDAQIIYSRKSGNVEVLKHYAAICEFHIFCI